MHIRNIILTTLVWAVIISAAFTFFPQLARFDVLGLFYFPSILLSVIFSGGDHSPSALSSWSSFLIYTLFYWAILLIVYASLLEIYLRSKVLHHLEDAKRHMTSGEPSSNLTLEKIGFAIREVETNRRKHFLLKNMDNIDLTLAPNVIAAHAISGDKEVGPIKNLLKHLEAKLLPEVGSEKVTKLMAKLHQDADHFASRNSGNHSSSGNEPR